MMSSVSLIIMLAEAMIIAKPIVTMIDLEIDLRIEPMMGPLELDWSADTNEEASSVSLSICIS